MCPPITYRLLPVTIFHPDRSAYVDAAHVQFVDWAVLEWAEHIVEHWPGGIGGPATHIVFPDTGMCTFVLTQAPVTDVVQARPSGYEEVHVGQVFLHLYQDGIEWAGGSVLSRRITWAELKG